MPLITTYNPLPITFTHGEGIWLYDEKINSSYDLNNNRLCDTSFVWSILNLAWEYSSLQTYSFDISNHLQSNTNYIWNSA